MVTKTPQKIACLIMAAGTAERFGNALPKQYCRLAGQTVLRRTIDAYAKHPQVSAVHVVIDSAHESFYQDAVKDLDLPAPVYGGATRQDSVRLGLANLIVNNYDYVLIADAARPLTGAATISRVIEALTPACGVIAALPVQDTLKQSDAHSIISDTRARDGLWQAQTPQGFPLPIIYDLHKRHKDHAVTDDAALFERVGLPVKLVMGDVRNFKITTQDDLLMAEKLLAQPTETHIGHGYDIHRFTAGNHIWLGGIKIAHDCAVEAHSDGDVFLDALTDALLGAVGAGDIGQHFPPSDPQWQNASSDRFVKHALGLIQERDGRIINVDLTLFAEAPKLGPHREKIQRNIAQLLDIDILRVNVKAKTGETMGFIGRREGLTADAVVSIELPRGL